MSSALLRTVRAAGPAARSARQVASRRSASSAAPFEINAPYKFRNDMPWIIGSALVFVPLIAYNSNDLYHSSIWESHGHGHSDEHVAHHAKEGANDNTFTKGTPMNAQKEMRSNEAPIENSAEAASAKPRSANGPDEKTTISDRKNSDATDPVAERSGSTPGQGIPKTLHEVTGKTTKEEHASDETKAEQTMTVEESKAAKGIKGGKNSEAHGEQKGQLADGEKHDHVREEEGTAKGSEEEKTEEKADAKEVEASTEKAIESDGDPAAAKKAEEESS